jgi:hypothetical protein
VAPTIVTALDMMGAKALAQAWSHAVTAAASVHDPAPFAPTTTLDTWPPSLIRMESWRPCGMGSRGGVGFVIAVYS